MRRTSAVLTLLVAVSPAWAGGSPSAGSFPGGVYDPKTRTLYAQAANGGLEAIDVTTGKVSWKNDAFSQPLALADGRLFVQVPDKGKANVVRIHVFDPMAPGEEVLKSDPVTFPDWVNVGTAHGRSFSSRVAAVGDNKLSLGWEARAWYAGGARPTPEIEKAARKEAHGTAEIDLKTGKVVMLEGTKVDTPSMALPKELDGVKSAAYTTVHGADTRPVIVGNKVAALSLSPQAGKSGQALTLQTWDLKTGKADKGVPLTQGRNLWLQLDTAGRYLFVRDDLPKGNSPADPLEWQVFSLEDGKLVAKLLLPQYIPALHYGDGTVFTLTETSTMTPKGGQRTRQLRAIDPATGKTTWERSLYAPPILPPLP